MRVYELREILSKFDNDDEIILSKDGEGNDFSPLWNYSESVYVPCSNYSGDIYIKKLTDNLIRDGYTEEDIYRGDDGINAVVLWPSN